MKLYFEPNLDYQRQAIEATCGLFRGQEICRGNRRPKGTHIGAQKGPTGVQGYTVRTKLMNACT